MCILSFLDLSKVTVLSCKTSNLALTIMLECVHNYNYAVYIQPGPDHYAWMCSQLQLRSIHQTLPPTIILKHLWIFTANFNVEVFLINPNIQTKVRVRLSVNCRIMPIGFRLVCQCYTNVNSFKGSHLLCHIFFSTM